MEVKFGFFSHLLTGLGIYDVTQFHTADIKQWYVKEGDDIKKGDLICNCDHDKGSFDISSIDNGKIKKLYYAEGEKWERGPEEETPFGVLFTPELGIIEIRGELENNQEIKHEKNVFDSLPSSANQNQESQNKKRIVVSPTAREIILKYNIPFDKLELKYLSKGRIEKEDVERYIKEEKELKEAEARIHERTMTQIKKQVKEHPTIQEKTIVAPALENIISENVEAVSKQIAAVPAARRLAQERKIDLASIKGSGERGIIRVEDIDKIHLLDKLPPQLSPIHPSLRDAEQNVPATEIRKTIAAFLTKSKLMIPHAGDEITIDITRFKENRDNIKEFWEKTQGTELKYDHFIMYFVAKNILQKEFSILNAYWDWGADWNTVLEAILIGNYNRLKPKIVDVFHVNLGIAVQTSDGLVVPVVHNAEQMKFVELVRASNQKVEQAILRKLALTDLRDLTVTINRVAFFDETRGEIIGGERPESIIPYTVGINGERSTSLILAFGKIKEENGRKLLIVAFRFDHRITDGAIPLRFVYALKDFLEKDCASSKKFAEIITT